MSKVSEPVVIHDVLWQFNCALSSHPIQQMASKVKAFKENEEDQKREEKVTSW